MSRSSIPEYHGAHIDLDYEPFGPAEVTAIIAYVDFPIIAPFDEERLRIKLCRLAQNHQALARFASAPSAASDQEFLAALSRAAARLTKMIPLNGLPDGASADEFQPEPSFGVWRLLEIPLHHEMHAQVERAQLDSLKADEARGNLAMARDATIRPKPPRVDNSITAEELFGSASGKEVLILANRINGLIAAAAKSVLAGMKPAGKTEASGSNERTCVKLMKLYHDAFGREIAFSRGAEGVVVGPMIRFVSKCLDVLGIHLAPGSIAKIKQDHFRAKADDSS